MTGGKGLGPPLGSVFGGLGQQGAAQLLQNQLQSNPLYIYNQFSPGQIIPIPKGEGLTATSKMLQMEEMQREILNARSRIQQEKLTRDIEETLQDAQAQAKPHIKPELTFRQELQAKIDYWLRDWRKPVLIT